MLIHEFYDANGARLGDLITRPGVKTSDLPTSIYEPIFSDGPQVSVGPFLFSAAKSAFSYKITQAKWQSSPVWLKQVEWAISKAYGLSKCYPVLKLDSGTILDWNDPRASSARATCIPSTQNKTRTWHRLIIPNDIVLDTDFLSGKKPIAKFKHPAFNEDWGLFVTLSEYGTVTFEFKKADKGFWASLWSFLESLVAMLIKLVTDFFKLLRGVFCSQVDGYLDLLNKVAARDKNLDLVQTQAKFDAINMGGVADAVWKGGLTGMACQAVATQVADSVCPKPKPETQIKPAQVKQYSPGSVQAQNPITKKWIVASPLAGATTLGTSPEGVQYRLVDEQGDTIANVSVISWEQLQKWLKPPWYKSLWFWGGAVAVLGVGYGSYRMIKRRRA